MPRRDSLNVWLYDRHVATFSFPKPWIVECRYTDAALEAWEANRPLLSCSLPLQRRRQDASVFASGLLPEGQHRRDIAAGLGVAVTDVYSLLRRLGRDVAGAAEIFEGERSPSEASVEQYTPETLAEEVLSLPDRPLGIHDDSELSLPGLQDKLLLVKTPHGEWARPVGGAPSTHILKIEDRRFPGLIEAEASCLRIAQAIGLTQVEMDVRTFDDIPALIVSRFDRYVGADGIRRVHQEDACQALARDPDAALGRGKYEREGGPRLVEIAELLDRYAAHPVTELDRLVTMVTYTLIIGNADAHGRNVSLLHQKPGQITLAPVYDTVPTLLWPKLRAESAMSVSGECSLMRVTRDHVVDEAARWYQSRERAVKASAEIAERMLAEVEGGQGSKAVAELVRSRAERFLAGRVLGGA